VAAPELYQPHRFPGRCMNFIVYGPEDLFRESFDQKTWTRWHEIKAEVRPRQRVQL
jgi:hypothetical protein